MNKIKGMFDVQNSKPNNEHTTFWKFLKILEDLSHSEGLGKRTQPLECTLISWESQGLGERTHPLLIS